MTGDKKSEPSDIGPANDNANPPKAQPPREALERVDRVTMKLAQLIGRQMAREDFAARMAAAANTNTPPSDDGPQDEPDAEA